MTAAAYTNRNSVKTILFAGLLTGALDILAAFIDYYIHTTKGPEGVLRFIASGVFGTKAFSGSSAMIWLGLLFHFIVAFLFTVFFYWLYPRAKFLRVNIALTAILYGAFVWCVMNLIVVPLSNTPKFPFNAFNAIKAAIILMFTIGLPLSIIMKNVYRNLLITEHGV